MPAQRRHSLKTHLFAWFAVGIACGWCGMQSLSIADLLAFTLSGTICGLMMGMITYPLARQPVLVVVGAFCGFILGCSAAWHMQASAEQNLPGMCLIMGGLIGSTAIIWQAPLRLLQPRARVIA